MTETDILNDLLESNPNEPASKGMVMLLRAEMRSEFHSVRSDISELKHDFDGRLDRILSLVDLVAQQVAAQGQQLAAQGQQLAAQGQQLGTQGQQLAAHGELLAKILQRLG